MSQSCVDHLNQETSGTLTARYYKGVYASGDNIVLEPNGNRGGVQAKLIKVGNTTPSGKSQCCSVYDPNGIYPTVCAGTHGNANPSILEIKEIIDDE